MSQVYLEVTYRDGKPWAGYLYLGKANQKRDKCRRVEPGMVLDINKDKELIGIELTAPTLVTLEHVNPILKEYGLEPLDESTLAPLQAA